MAVARKAGSWTWGDVRHWLGDELLDHAHFHAALGMPRRSVTSSMKLRMKKMPRPLDLSRFSGASGSAISSGSKPSPWSRTR